MTVEAIKPFRFDARVASQSKNVRDESGSYGHRLKERLRYESGQNAVLQHYEEWTNVESGCDQAKEGDAIEHLMSGF